MSIDNERINEITLSLEEAIEKNEEVDTQMGIIFSELKDKEENHNRVFIDKWGTLWIYKDHQLLYNHMGLKRHTSDVSTIDFENEELGWEYGNIDGCDINFKRYFTYDEYQSLKDEFNVLKFLEDN